MKSILSVVLLGVVTSLNLHAEPTLVFNSQEGGCVSLQSLDGANFSRSLFREAKKCSKLQKSDPEVVDGIWGHELAKSVEGEFTLDLNSLYFTTNNTIREVDGGEYVTHYYTYYLTNDFALSSDKKVLTKRTTYILCYKSSVVVGLDLQGNCKDVHEAGTQVFIRTEQ